MRGFAAQVGDIGRRFGAGRAARYLAWRIAHRLVGYMPYRGFVLPASRAARTSAAVSSGIICREVKLSELSSYVSDPQYDLGERFLAEAHARGDCCIGAFDRDRLVSYSFNSKMPTNIDAEFRYHFPDGWVYHFKALTLPQWRGRKLHACLMSAALAKFAKNSHFRGMTTLVVATNYPSLASFSRLGFEPAFRFAIVGKGAKRRVAASHGTGAPFAIERI